MKITSVLASSISEALLTYNVTVSLTTSGNSNLVKRETCSGPAALVGRQVRLEYGGDFILITVTSSSGGNTVVLHQEALDRFTTPPTAPFSAVLRPRATWRAGAPIPAATVANEYVEAWGTGSAATKYFVMAPHGGNIEAGTDGQVVTAHTVLQGCYWYAKGRKSPSGAYDRWHCTSTYISANSFPGLKLVTSKLTQLNVVAGVPKAKYAVAFHGFSQNKIVIGGGGPDSGIVTSIKNSISSSLATALPGGTVIEIAAPGDAFDGDDPDNIVNRYSSVCGIQIEQGLSLRQTYGTTIATAVAGVLNGLS